MTLMTKRLLVELMATSQVISKTKQTENEKVKNSIDILILSLCETQYTKYIIKMRSKLTV